MTHNPVGPAGSGMPGQAEDPRTGPPGRNAWIPSLAIVLEKQRTGSAAPTAPPPGATGFTGSGNQPSSGQSSLAPKPALYGARAINDNAIPEFVKPTRRPRRRVNKPLVLLVLLVLLGAGGGAGYWFYDKHNQARQTAADAATEGRTLTFPRAVAGMHELTKPSSYATSIASRMRTRFGGAKPMNIRVGEYHGRNMPVTIVLAFKPRDNPELYDEMLANGVEHSVDSTAAGFAHGIAINATDHPVSIESFDPGTEGGAMRCSTALVRTVNVGSCVWGDRSFVAINIVLHAKSVDSTAQIAREVREAAEH